MRSEKQVMVRPRQAGKTTDALRWVFKGEPCAGYPGWTRVLIVPSLQMETYMRRMTCPTDIAEQVIRLKGQDPAETWWQALRDWSHRVYMLEEFRSGKFRPAPETEWCIDDFDMCLTRDQFLVDRVLANLRVTRLILTGEDWTNE